MCNFRFEGLVLSLLTTQSCCCGPKAAIDNMKTNAPVFQYTFIHRNGPWAAFDTRDEVCWIAALDSPLCFCFFVRGVWK